MQGSNERRHSTQEEALQIGLRFTYRPGSDSSAPLIALIHGRAGTRDVMWLFERVLPPHAAVVSFEAPTPDPVGGFSWWDITVPGASVNLAPGAALLVAESLRLFEELFQLNPSYRIALGFSQGAALLSVSVQTALIDCAGYGLLAGFIVPVRRPEGTLSNVPVFIAHGLKDDIISVERAREGRDLLSGYGYPVTYVEDDVGHKIGVGATRALSAWLTTIK